MKRGMFAPPTRTTLATAINEAGGTAFEMAPEHALAQYTCTGCFADTYYTRAEDQLATILALGGKVSDDFLAKCAVYGRTQGFMKDMPVALLVLLASKKTNSANKLVETIFSRVVDNAVQVRKFVKMIRSGAFGRKSLGSLPRRLVGNWLNNASPAQILNGSVGNDPSLHDVLSLARPKPKDHEREAMFGWVVGKAYSSRYLPDIFREYEAWKKGEGMPPRGVDFRLFTARPLGTCEWEHLAETMNWHALRMNLNTLCRHGVFKDASKELIAKLAAKLRDEAAIRKAKAFPYQLLMAYRMATEAPAPIREALQDALDCSLQNVPEINGQVVVCPDVSGSMTSCSVTGDHGSASSAVRPVDVAALVAAALLRVNKDAIILPFDTSIHSAKSLNPRDSVMTNAEKLAEFGGGGTDCGLPVEYMITHKIKADAVIYVSDSESWMHGYRGDYWRNYQRFNPKAKLMAIDTMANSTSQFPETCSRTFNVGGFSDHVFTLMDLFVNERGKTWVDVISAVSLK
jgi:60 kDa SS-A/Ro ribonucleoprotein